MLGCFFCCLLYWDTMRLTAYFKCALIALPLNLFAQLEGDALAIVSAINDCFFELDHIGITLNSIDSIAENIQNGESQFHGDIINLLNSRFTGLEQTVANNTSFITDRLRTLQTDIAYIRSHNAHIERALYESYDGSGYGTGRSIFQEVRYGFQSITNLLMRNIQAMQPITLLTNIYAAQLGISDVFHYNNATINSMMTNSLAYSPAVASALYSRRDAFQPVWFLPWSDTEYEPEILNDPDLATYLDNIYEDVVYDLRTLSSGAGDHWGYDGVGISYYKLYGTLALRQAIDATATNLFDATLPGDDVQDAQVSAGLETIRAETGDDDPESGYQTETIEEEEDKTFADYFEDLRKMGTDDSDFKSISDELEQKIQDVSNSIDDILPTGRRSSKDASSGLVLPYNIDLSGIFGGIEGLPPELSTLEGQIDFTVSPADVQLFHYGFTLIGWVVRVSIFFYTGIQLFNHLAAGLSGQVAQEQSYRDALDEL